MQLISINKTSSWLLMFLVFLPFAVVTNFKFGPAFINAKNLSLYVLFAVIFYSFFSMGIRKIGGYLFLCAILLFCVYIIFSVFFLGAGIPLVLRHAEFFLPFIVAAALMASRIKFDRKKFELTIFWTVVFSALTALAAYLFFSDLLQSRINQFNEEVADIFGAGRLYWDGGSLSLFAIFLFFSSPYLRKNKAPIIGLVVVLLAIFATQNRTMALACAVLLVYYIKISFRTLFLVLAIGVIGYIFFGYLSEDARDLFLNRFFFGNAAKEFERAFEVGRVGLYEQYLDIIKSHVIFGAGLGFPLSYNQINGVSVYISDVSIVSFFVPFGLFGLVLFFYLLRCIYCGIVALRHGAGVIYAKNLMILFIVSLFISLNIDVFSRDVFILVLVALIFSMKLDVAPGGAVRR